MKCSFVSLRNKNSDKVMVLRKYDRMFFTKGQKGVVEPATDSKKSVAVQERI